MAIYKVVLNGQCQGQDIKNILYYRTGLGIDIEGLTVGGTVEVANAVKAEVWTALKLVMHQAYTLQDISAYVYDEAEFRLLYQNPTTVGVNENGDRTGALNGPATCAIVRFELEPHLILVDGPKPPKRGYLAIGPLDDGTIGDTGIMTMSSELRLQWDAVCLALSMNLETLIPPAVFFPIRVHQDLVLGFMKITSFADVRDCVLRTGTSFRRSRMPEA